MKHVLLTILIFIITSSIDLEAQTFQWAKSMGVANLGCVGNSICTDAAGNVYTIGYFDGIIDFDPGPGVYNLTPVPQSINCYISKLTASGNFIWARSISATTWLTGSRILLDASNNIFITGDYTGTADFDPGPGIYNAVAPNANSDGFLLKLDANGNFTWVKTWGGIEGEAYITMCLDNPGNIYLTGRFAGTMDADPGPGVSTLNSVDLWDVFISKFDNNGNFIFAKSFAGPGNGYSDAIQADANQNIYITGRLYNNVDFDPGPNVFNLTAFFGPNMYVCKLNPTGDFMWAEKIGANLASQEQHPRDMVVDNSGIYITGHYSGTTDFDPDVLGNYTLTAAGTTSVFILKLNTDGNFVWARSMGGGGINYATSIDIDNTGKVYTTGYSNGGGDFDPGPAVYNLYNNYLIFVSCIDTAGNFKWARQLNGGVNGLGNCLHADNNGSIYSTGRLAGTGDFDPGIGVYNLTVQGQADAYIHKMKTCENTLDTMHITACKFYVLNGQTYDSTGFYSQSLVNAQGCDSVLTLDLTIQNVDTSILKSGTQLFAAVNTSYQWIQCNPYQVISGETNQSYNATANGSYACIVIQNGCTDTTNCVTVSGISGTNNTFLENSLKIYPNPSNGVFTFELNEQNYDTIEISNQLGETIMEIPVNAPRTIIRLTSQRGMFYYRVLNEGVVVGRGKILIY